MIERNYSLDFLRGFMMLLGIWFHGLRLSPRIEYLSDAHNGTFFNVTGDIIHTFRMPLFFCLSGYLSVILFKKLGTIGFLKNRVKRILVPFVVSYLTIGVLCKYLEKSISFRNNGLSPLESLKSGFSSDDFLFVDLKANHLWFIYYLFLFIVLTIVICQLTKNLEWSRLKVYTPSKKRRDKILLCSFIVSTVPLSYLLIAYEHGEGYGFQEVRGIQIRTFLFTYNFFLFGWLMHKFKFDMSIFKVRPKLFILFGLCPIAFKVWLFPQLKNSFFAQILTLSISETLSIWFLICGLLGLALIHFNKKSNILSYLTDSSYWIYLIHFPIILFFKVIFFTSTPFSTFLTLLGLTFALCFLSYHFLVRPTFIGKSLNGKKRPFPSLFLFSNNYKSIENIKNSSTAYIRYFKGRAFTEKNNFKINSD